jgi:hypothetical protein
MSSAYNGLPGNESRKATLTVSGATNATPIQITTTAAHGLATGERVWIYGVQGNNAANGVFYVSVTGPTTFTLYSGFTAGAPSGAVAGSGAYVAAGARVCAPLTWTASSLLPDDGDPVNASSINTPLEGNFDREAWLLGRAGRYACSHATDGSTYAVPNAFFAFVNTGAPGWGPNVALGGGIDILPGDVLEMSVSINAALTTGAGPVALRLSVAFTDYGGAVLQTRTGPDVSLSAAVPTGLTLLFSWDTSIAALPNGCEAVIEIEAYSGAGLQQVSIYGSRGIVPRVWRPVS